MSIGPPDGYHPTDVQSSCLRFVFACASIVPAFAIERVCNYLTASQEIFRMPLGLVALAIGGFGIGLTEFVIMPSQGWPGSITMTWW